MAIPVALCLRNSGSQTPDCWLKLDRNTQNRHMLRMCSVSDIRIRIIYFIGNATSFSLRFNSVSFVRTIKKEQHGCPQASLRHHTVLFCIALYLEFTSLSSFLNRNGKVPIFKGIMAIVTCYVTCSPSTTADQNKILRIIIAIPISL